MLASNMICHTQLNDLAPVVQKLDSAMHRINHYALESTFGSLKLIRWIEIYPVDGAIQL